MWFQGVESAPPKYQIGMDSWKTANKDYEYIFWDENSICNLMEDSYPEFFTEWSALDPLIKKCDSARYFILHKYGGIYADLDTFAHKSIDFLINDLSLETYPIILSEESMDPQSWKSGIARDMAKEHNLKKIVANAVMLSEKRQDFWLDYLKASFKISDKKLLDSFGPWHLSRFIQSMESNDLIGVLPYEYLMSSKPTDKSYATHSYDATWFDNSKPTPWDV